MEGTLFHAVDYFAFILLLVVSMGIGIFFAVSSFKKKSTRAEYLMGSRQMSLVPVTLSMAVSVISANTLLGTPAETYAFGAQFEFALIGVCLGAIISTIFYVPLFFNLKITSANEYLYLRYRSKSVQALGSIILLLNQILYIGCVIFGPAIALKTATGVPPWASILIVSFIGTAYTTVGGMKAVVWADAFQSIIMLAGMVAIIVIGSNKVGGIDEVWRLNDQWGRIFLNLSVDPSARMTLWTMMIGYTVYWVGGYGVNQPCVQRFCAMSTLRRGRMTMLFNAPVFVILHSVSVLTGMVAFAYYAKKGCDPLASGAVQNANQIVPYFVMDVLSYPGLPGIFVSSIFSGSLSTLSSSINSMAAVVWQDFLENKFQDLHESRKTLVTKCLVVFFGLVCMGVSFVVLHVGGNLAQISTSFFGCTIGPLLGVFTLGALFPFANAKGAMIGGVSSIVIVLWMMFGQVFSRGHRSSLPSDISQCISFNNTIIPQIMTTDSMSYVTASYTAIESDSDDIFWLYTISFAWFCVIGFVCVIVIGCIASLIFGGYDRQNLESEYVFPCVPSRANERPKQVHEIKEIRGLVENEFKDKEEYSLKL